MTHGDVMSQRWGRKESNLRPSDYEFLRDALSAAIQLQETYIVAVLGCPLAPVTGRDDGWLRDVVCAWCGQVGHTMGRCPYRQEK